MKRILLVLVVCIIHVSSFGQTKTGDWVIYHAHPNNTTYNNGVERIPFLQASPIVNDSISGYISGDPRYYFSWAAYSLGLKKCDSIDDNSDTECWSTIEQNKIWHPTDEFEYLQKMSYVDTVGMTNGRIMTLHAAQQAIDVLESDMNTAMSGKSNTGHTHSYSTLTSIPTTFQPSAHSHAPSDIISAPWLTSFTEVDGSVTNEIELASQTGQSGKYLTTNGTTTSWVNITSTNPGANDFTSYSSGTAYNVTTTSAKVTFGTNSPSITITTPGKYIIMSNVRIDYNGLTNVAANTVTVKLRRTNNTASDLTNANGDFVVPPVTLLTATGGDCDISTITYTTSNSNDVIEIWASRSGSISVGNIQAGNAWIVAYRIN